MASSGSRSNTVLCTGGCGLPVLSHVVGSEAAISCTQGSPGRSKALKVKNAIRNQDIKVRTHGNDMGSYHNAILRMAEKLFRVAVIGRVRKLPVRGYDQQTEEFFEGGSDRQFNEAQITLSMAMETHAQDSSQESADALKLAYADMETAAELRARRLQAQGKIGPDFNWRQKNQAHWARHNASIKFNLLTPEEKAEVIEQERVSPSVPDAEVNQLIEDGVVPHIEHSDEDLQDGIRLLQQEAEVRQREAAAHTQYVAERKASKLITPDSDEWDF